MMLINMNKLNLVSKNLCILLKRLGFNKPSKYYYEYSGSDQIEETKDGKLYYLPDNINIYTSNQIKRSLPKNVAINENVIEIGYKKDDTLADKRAKLLIWLIENQAITI